MKGEGESSALSLMRVFTNGPSADIAGGLAGIRGISYRVGPKIFSNGRPQLIANLDSLPSPILTDVIPPHAAQSIGVMLNRGCDHFCIYCAFATMNYHRVRSFSCGRVLGELEHLCNCRTLDRDLTISFLDDNFLANRDEAFGLCKELTKNNRGFSYFCQFRSELVTPQVLGLLKAAGFKTVAMGLESTSPRLLGIIKKNGAPVKPARSRW